MDKLMCPTSLLWSQVGHAALLGLALLLLGLIALALDLAAHRAGQLGAGRPTVWLLKGAAWCLLGLDVFVILVVAVAHAEAATACLSSVVQRLG
jgi:hypothetical protein